MNVFLKKLCLIILCLSVVFSLISCDLLGDAIYDAFHRSRYVPKGYTGGFNIVAAFHNTIEVNWLETYDELMHAITLLKNNGSNIGKDTPEFYGSCRNVVLNCDQYNIDVKFCISNQRSKSESPKKGKDHFDRKMGDFSVVTYVFFEDVPVTIEEIEYSYIHVEYKFITILPYPRTLVDYPEGADDLRIYRDDEDTSKYYIFYHGRDQIDIKMHNMEEIPEEVLQIIAKSIVIIE